MASSTVEDRLERMMALAESNAWTSLARYKFVMAGYHQAQWVSLNHLLDKPKPNPFRLLVEAARAHLESDDQWS